MLQLNIYQTRIDVRCKMKSNEIMINMYFRVCVRIFNIDYERGREIEIIIIISYNPYFLY